MQIVCNKVREGDQRIVCIKEGDPRGRHVVIVDDLVQSGGTLIECQVYKFFCCSKNFLFNSINPSCMLKIRFLLSRRRRNMIRAEKENNNEACELYL